VRRPELESSNPRVTYRQVKVKCLQMSVGKARSGPWRAVHRDERRGGVLADV
jgi:hypothetical protein